MLAVAPDFANAMDSTFFQPLGYYCRPQPEADWEGEMPWSKASLGDPGRVSKYIQLRRPRIRTVVYFGLQLSRNDRKVLGGELA